MRKVYREHDRVILTRTMSRGWLKSEYARREVEYFVEDFVEEE